MSTPSDVRRATRLAGSAGAAALKAGELAIASAEVISRRTHLGATALGAPSAAAAVEAATMVSEKGFAAARSSLAASKAISELSIRSASLALNEAQIMARATVEASRCATPLELAAVQGDYAYKAFGRLFSQSLAWASLAAAAGSAAMAPFHTAAVANARRLRK